MRNLSIVMFMLVTLGVKAGAIDSTVKTVEDSISKLSRSIMPDSTKLTWLKVYEDTKEGIASLGKALKVPAEHVYAVLVKQQVVNAITELLAWFILPLVLTIVMFKLTTRWKLFTEKMIDDSEGVSAFIGGIVIALPVLFILVGCSWQTITTGIINPEYGAIQDIWKFVKH